VSSCTVARSHFGKQIAYIEFWDKNAETNAALLNQTVLHGEKLEVELLFDEDIVGEKHSNPPLNGHDPTAGFTKEAIIDGLEAAGYIVPPESKHRAVAWDNGSMSFNDKLSTLGSSAKSRPKAANARFGLGGVFQKKNKKSPRKSPRHH